jgi:hypothetical protein
VSSILAPHTGLNHERVGLTHANAPQTGRAHRLPSIPFTPRELLRALGAVAD